MSEESALKSGLSREDTDLLVRSLAIIATELQGIHVQLKALNKNSPPGSLHCLGCCPG